jgi:hypothetical protein
MVPAMATTATSIAIPALSPVALITPLPFFRLAAAVVVLSATPQVPFLMASPISGWVSALLKL